MNASSSASRNVLSLATASMIGFLAQPTLAADAESRGAPWPRHTIDDSSRGADGVRLCDVNQDQRPDVVTGWEQGGLTRIYLHPGSEHVHGRWPAVTVGKTPSVEDAVFVDLDADGSTDVVSSCEGGTKAMFVHWAPKRADAYLLAGAWQTEPIPASRGRMMWMFCTPVDLDGRAGVDLVAAGNMSLRLADFDGDGDPDVLASDRKGPDRGCRWLENPGPGSAQVEPWPNHFIGGRDHEVMFLTIADLDGDRRDDVLCATRDDGLLFFRRRPAGDGWQTHPIPMPDNVGTGKAVEVGDVDLDGKPDLVFSCENARGDRSGVTWLSRQRAPADAVWTAREISGPAGVKFDRLELLDLDADGDLDVLACEESQPTDGPGQGLGVFWYENPIKAASR
ncbi:MAG: FG-GAP repeat domain-containing protein [Planctomycetota bacterium]